MKVFISWSGERSRLVAEALRYWLPKVIQAIQPWMSSSDIEKGTRWRTDIASELEQSSIGIICLTPENLSSTWLHFESGALSKQQQNTYVCTFLYGLEPADIREPLAQFQTTKSQLEDVRKLIQTINNALGENKLLGSEVNESFDVWWPKLQERLSSIPEPQSSPQPQRDDREILEEILELIRSQARGNRVSNIAANLQQPYFPSTANWPIDDARLIFSYYNSLDNLTKNQQYAASRSELDRLVTDEVFAKEKLLQIRRLQESFKLHAKKRRKSSVKIEEPPNENTDS